MFLSGLFGFAQTLSGTFCPRLCPALIFYVVQALSRLCPARILRQQQKQQQQKQQQQQRRRRQQQQKQQQQQT